MKEAMQAIMTSTHANNAICKNRYDFYYKYTPTLTTPYNIGKSLTEQIFFYGHWSRLSRNPYAEP